MRRAKGFTATARREEGFTLIELIVVMVIIGVLLSVAFVFHYGARERSSDATAKSNLRIAVPAIEAYRSENGGYAGMTVAGLKSTYNAGIAGIVVEWTTDDNYCVSSTLNGRAGWKQGPAGAITQSAC
jgi:prepilin-type N-terminal cleavage/methylation domain-containing protein